MGYGRGRRPGGRVQCGARSAFSGAAPTTAPVKVGWTRSDLKPVSQPVAAGGRFILYVSGASGPAVVALDPITGNAGSRRAGVVDHARRATGARRLRRHRDLPRALPGELERQAGRGRRLHRQRAVDGASGDHQRLAPTVCRRPHHGVHDGLGHRDPPPPSCSATRPPTAHPCPAPEISTTDLSPAARPRSVRPPAVLEQLVATNGESSVVWHRPLTSVPSGYSTDYMDGPSTGPGGSACSAWSLPRPAGTRRPAWRSTTSAEARRPACISADGTTTWRNPRHRLHLRPPPVPRDDTAVHRHLGLPAAHPRAAAAHDGHRDVPHDWRGEHERRGKGRLEVADLVPGGRPGRSTPEPALPWSRVRRPRRSDQRSSS